MIGYDIYADIAGYQKDVLILHGDADYIVPLSSSTEAVNTYASAELQVFPGAGHGFHGDDLEEAKSMIFTYLEEHRN